MSDKGEAAFILGPHAVEEALRAGRRAMRVLYVARGREDRRLKEILARARDAGVEVKQTGRRELTRLCGSEHHQGLAALVGGLLLECLADSVALHLAFPPATRYGPLAAYQNLSNRSCFALQIGQTPGGRSRAHR